MAIDKNSVIKEAQKFVAKGQFDKAIAEWKKLLRESPSDPNIYNTIGDLCLKKDAKADAVDAYRRAADILAADGFTSKAIALYKKVLNINPQEMEVHLALGDLNAEKGITGAALESYKVIADYYTHQKDMVKALGIYQKMADLSPSNVTFRVKLGDMYAKEGMKEDAAKAYLDAADAHVSKDAFQDARLLFEKVLTLDPNNKEVYHKAGIVYFKEGKFAEASKALKPAFENDPSNQELADTYLDALYKAGKTAETQDALKKLIEDAGRTELREQLYQLYLADKEYGKALAEASLLAQAKTESGEDAAAEEILKTFVSENPQFSPGRQKLAEFYAANYRKDDAVKELMQAASLLAEEGDREGSKALLGRALEIDPHAPGAKEQLERMEGSTFAPTPPLAPEFTAPEPIAPEPSVAQPAVERAPAAVVFEMPPPPPAEPPVAAEDPAIHAAFTEAEVLIKYGMAAKAAEQLEKVAAQHPGNPRVRVKLQDLYREQGNPEKVVQHTLALSEIYTKLGRNDMAKDALQSVLDMARENPGVLALLGKAPAAPAEAQPPETMPEIAPSSFEEAPPILGPSTTGSGDESIPFEGLDTQFPPLEEIPPFEAPPAVTEPEEEQLLTEEAPPVTKQPSAPEVREERKAEPEADLNEIWAEAEFYYQQGLFDEARKHYAKIIGITPSDRRVIERLAEISREEDDTREFTKLAEAVEGLEEGVFAESGGGDLAASASDDEAVRSLMKEIEDLRKEQKPAPPPPRREAPPKKPQPFRADEVFSSFATQAEKPAEKDFFDLGAELEADAKKAASAQGQKTKSNDFFDLAAELRDELSSAPAAARPSVPPEEQSLDDIFEEFKKGVEEQAVKEDTGTHYNLGVAYKEMGLLDDAIAEFSMTPEGESRYVQSRYMLGLCYMEQGEYKNAIEEIFHALNYAMSRGTDEQTRISMQYDLGLAYQGLGKNKEAIDEFQQIYDVSPRYRDVAAKLKELRKGEFISLDQLKDDIEKEISAKFTEEGERIQREEQSKKGEKVKNW